MATENEVAVDIGDDAPDPVGKLAGFEAALAKAVVDGYEGGVVNGRYHGAGKLQHKHAYEGNLRFGKLHGQGKLTWKDGVSYMGQFVQNKISGLGVYRWPDGGEYFGQLRSGVRHGNGVYTREGVRYEGGWLDGAKHGLGVLSFADGSFYEGQFERGRKHGWGRMVFASGSRYEGQWSGDRRNGCGAMEWVLPAPPEATRTESPQLQVNRKTRQSMRGRRTASRTLKKGRGGSWHQSSRDLKTGSPSQARPLSPGLVTVLAGGRIERYAGEWKDGKPHGMGTYVWLCKAVREGEDLNTSGFSVGSDVNKFEHALPGENVFVGKFNAGHREGSGVLYLADGTALEAVWAGNVKEGRAVVRRPDGSAELLFLKENVIIAKRLLVPRAGDPSASTEERTDRAAGLTLSSSEASDAAALCVADLLEHLSEEEQQLESRALRDLVRRCVPSLKFLYRFFARVAPQTQLRAPAHLLCGTGPGADLGLMPLAAAAATAAADARALEAASVKQAPELPEVGTPDLTLGPRGRLIHRLHQACQRAAADAAECGAAALASADRREAELDQHDQREAPHPLRNMSPSFQKQVTCGEPATMLTLRQFWELLRSAGVPSAELTLSKQTSIIAGVLRHQPYLADSPPEAQEQTGPWPPPASPPTTPDAPSPARPRRSSTPFKPSVVGSRRPTQTRPSSPSSPPAKPASTDARVCESRLRSRRRRRQRKSREMAPDDGEAPVLFVAFVECIVRLSYHSALFSRGHTYSHAAQGVRLSQCVLWALTNHFGPVYEALRATAGTTAGSRLGLPGLPSEMATNLTYRERPDRRHAKQRQHSARSAASAASSVETASMLGDIAVTVGAKATEHESGSEASPTSTMRRVNDESSEKTHTIRLTRGNRCTTSVVESRISFAGGENVGLSPAQLPQLNQHTVRRSLGLYVESDDSGRPLTPVSMASGAGQCAAILGIVTAEGQQREERRLDRDREAVDDYLRAEETIRSYNEQLQREKEKAAALLQQQQQQQQQQQYQRQRDYRMSRSSMMPDTPKYSSPAGSEVMDGTEASPTGTDWDEDLGVTQAAVAEAKAVLAQGPPPLLFEPALPPQVSLRTRPVREALRSASDRLAQLFVTYSEAGVFRVRHFVLLLRDYNLVDTAPPPSEVRQSRREKIERQVVAELVRRAELQAAAAEAPPPPPDSPRRAGRRKTVAKGRRQSPPATSPESNVSQPLPPSVFEVEEDEVEQPAFPLSCRYMLRHLLWYVMGIDVDVLATPCHIYTDPRFQVSPTRGLSVAETMRTRASESSAEPIVDTLNVTATLPFLYTTHGSLVGLRHHTSCLSTATAKSTRPNPEVIRKLQDRDRIVAKSEWFPPPPAVRDAVARYDWEYVVGDLPMQWDQFIEFIAMTALFAFPGLATAVGPGDVVDDSDFPDRVMMLLDLLAEGSQETTQTCVAELPIRLLPLARVRPAPEAPDEDAKGKKKK